MMPRTYMTGGETSESTNLKVLAASAAILGGGGRAPDAAGDRCA